MDKDFGEKQGTREEISFSSLLKLYIFLAVFRYSKVKICNIFALCEFFIFSKNFNIAYKFTKICRKRGKVYGILFFLGVEKK